MPSKGGMIRVIDPLIHSVRCFEGGAGVRYVSYMLVKPLIPLMC